MADQVTSGFNVHSPVTGSSGPSFGQRGGGGGASGPPDDNAEPLAAAMAEMNLKTPSTYNSPAPVTLNAAGGGDTHNKIFGSNASPACGISRKYHMESDIFGTGIGYLRPQNMAPVTSSHRGLDVGEVRIGDGVMADEAIQMGSPQNDGRPGAGGRRNPRLPGMMMDGAGIRRNARENGGNPVTGEGYTDAQRAGSRRRQFVPSRSAKLW